MASNVILKNKFSGEKKKPSGIYMAYSALSMAT